MIITPGLIISNNIVINGGHPTGQVEFTSPGTYSWVAPNGVSQVHVVAVGGGGNSRITNNGYPTGGAGGGLGWKNNIPVNAGTAYTVQVGGAAGNSYFIDTTVVCGFGAIIVSNPNTVPTQANALGGSFVGDGGGHGGNTGAYTASYRANPTAGTPSGHGAGGAGGYTGPGGDGARGSSNDMHYGTYGQGGGGAGSDYNGFAQAASGAGGVGIYGIGQSGRTSYGRAFVSQAPTGVPPQGGSGGQAGAEYNVGGGGGKYGGGGGGTDTAAGAGGSGAVRIIWGDNRRFPNINTANILQTF
jgi:hypothetical protein